MEFEGESYPLQELAQVGRKNPQLAVLNLASLPDAIQPVLKAIRDSGMNLNPQQEGTTIYVALPKYEFHAFNPIFLPSVLTPFVA